MIAGALRINSPQSELEKKRPFTKMGLMTAAKFHSTSCKCPGICIFVPPLLHYGFHRPAPVAFSVAPIPAALSASAGQWPASLVIRLPSPTARSPIAAAPWCADTSTTPTPISNLKPHFAASGCTNSSQAKNIIRLIPPLGTSPHRAIAPHHPLAPAGSAFSAAWIVLTGRNNSSSFEGRETNPNCS